MVHPLCRPDLPPSDFWLFSCLKRSLDSYPDAANLAKELFQELRSIRVHECQKTFQKWIERMKIFTEHRGDYFEHLL